MKTSEFCAPLTGGKRVLAALLIAALMLAALPAVGVLAAPPKQDGGTGGDDGSGGVTANQIRELQSAHTWFNNFRTRPGQNRNSDKISQYLDQYAFALTQANALLVNNGTNAGQGNGNGSNAQGNNGNNQGWGSAQQQMGGWLSMMRGLRNKIASSDNSNNNNNNNGGGNNGVGIPVTGGNTTGTGQTFNQNNAQSSSPAQTWGNQWSELQAAQTWFNNFRTKPGQDRNSERTSRYLDQYAFALRQAYAIIAGGTNATTNNQNQSMNQGLGNSQSDRTAAQQQLATWLHMMRGLHAKIAGQGGSNNSNAGNTNTGTANTNTGNTAP